MKLQPTPEKLFDPQGNPIEGIWQGLGPATSQNDFRAWNHGALKPLLTEKRWQFIGVFSPEYIVGLAVVDVGYLGMGWMYLYDRKTKELIEWEAKSPLGTHVLAERDPKRGCWSLHKKDQHLEIRADAEKLSRTVEIDLRRKGKHIKGRFELVDGGQSALAYLGGMAADRFNLTYKTAGLLTSGKLTLNDQPIDFPRDTTRGLVDWTWGCPARETYWNWSACTGLLSDGRTIGWNLATGINEGKNVENAFWVDGELEALGSVRFDYDPKNMMEPWEIKDEHERVSLRFQPEGMRSENINALVIKSRFFQPFGVYQGTITRENGEVLSIDNLPGVAEEHFALW